jgi:hypothetical protein
LDHRQPDRIPVDFGGTFVSGIHVSCVLALREYFGLEKKPVRAIDPGQFLGEIEEDLKLAMGIDTEGVIRRMTRFGFPPKTGSPSACTTVRRCWCPASSTSPSTNAATP